MAYAHTTVSVARSQDQLRKLLQRYGASTFEFGEGVVDGQQMAAVAFVAHGYRVRIRVPLKPPVAEAVRSAAKRRKAGPDDAHASLVEQEAKRIWRVLPWNVKARLEAVEEGVETFEEAFLAHLIDERSGRTIYEHLAQDGCVELGAPLRPELGAGS